MLVGISFLNLLRDAYVNLFKNGFEKFLEMLRKFYKVRGLGNRRANRVYRDDECTL